MPSVNYPKRKSGMTQSPENKRIKRRIIFMISTIVLLIGGMTIGWFYLANQIETRMNTQMAKLAEQGKTLNCINQRVEGYPFRVGLFCDQIIYDDQKGEKHFSAGNLRSAAQFYQPGFVVSELDSPAKLNLPAFPDLKLDWELARSSSRIYTDGLRRVSLKIDNLKVTGANGLIEDTGIVDFDLLELHVRPSGEETGSPDIETAINATGVQFFNALKEKLPPLDIKLDAVLTSLNKAIKSGKDISRSIRLNGLPLQVRNLELAMNNGARLSASGPLKIARDGLLEGTLNVEVEGFQQLIEEFAAQNPQLVETAKSLKAASSLFSNGSKDGIVRLNLQIRRGAVTMGFFPLGFIPKLF